MRRRATVLPASMRKSSTSTSKRRVAFVWPAVGAMGAATVLSVDVLAGHMNLCPRQFSRRFRDEFKSTPAAFVQRLRLDEARTRLSAAGATVEGVADSVGFHDPDSFRRAFVQRFGVPPQHYRGRFL